MYVRSPASERFLSPRRHVEGVPSGFVVEEARREDDQMAGTLEGTDEEGRREEGAHAHLEPVHLPEKMKQRIDAIGKDFGIADKIKLWLSIFLSIFDKTTDLLVLIGFAESKEWDFFAVMLVFHIVSGIAISVYMMEHYPWRSQTAKTADERERKVLYHVSMKYLGCFLALFQLGPTFAALRTLFTRDAYKRVKEQDFRGMKLIDTVFQSLPEICLQMYIGILKDRLVVGRTGYDAMLTASILASFFSVMGCYLIMEREPAFMSLYLSVKSLCSCSFRRKSGKQDRYLHKGQLTINVEDGRAEQADDLPQAENESHPLNTSPLSNDCFDWDTQKLAIEGTRDTCVEVALTPSSGGTMSERIEENATPDSVIPNQEPTPENVTPTKFCSSVVTSKTIPENLSGYSMTAAEKHYFVELCVYSITRFFEIASKVLWIAGLGVAAGVGALAGLVSFHFFAVIALLWLTSPEEIWRKIRKTTEATCCAKKVRVLKWNDTKMLVLNMAWPPGLWVSDATDSNGKFWWRDRRSGRKSFTDITGGLLGASYYNLLVLAEFIVCFAFMNNADEDYLKIYTTWAVWATFIWLTSMLLLRELFIHRPFGAGAMGTPPHLKDAHRLSRALGTTWSRKEENHSVPTGIHGHNEHHGTPCIERKLFVSPKPEEQWEPRTPFGRVDSNAVCPLPPLGSRANIPGRTRNSRRYSFGGLPQGTARQAANVAGISLTGNSAHQESPRRHSSPPRLARPLVTAGQTPGVVETSSLGSDSSEKQQHEPEEAVFGHQLGNTPISIHVRLRRLGSGGLPQSSEEESGARGCTPTVSGDVHASQSPFPARKLPLPTLKYGEHESDLASPPCSVSISTDPGVDEESDEENFWRMRTTR